MSKETALQALSIWNLENASLELIAERENQVFRVDDHLTQTSWALRIHRTGLRTKSEIRSELQWMGVLANAGLSTAAPLTAYNGALCEEINGQIVDMQAWLSGDTLATRASEEIYHSLGRAMAQLHTVSDVWTPPPGFDRPSWDLDGLLGEEPVWDRFWENPFLDKEQQLLLQQFRASATQVLREKNQTLDLGLIHADLVSENVLIKGDQLHFIDFDDSGYGYRLFDLATVILRLRRAPAHEAFTSALIDGYLSNRSIDLKLLDLFLALRACTYVGWIISRVDEASGVERCARFIANGCTHVNHWLESIAHVPLAMDSTLKN